MPAGSALKLKQLTIIGPVDVGCCPKCGGSVKSEETRVHNMTDQLQRAVKVTTEFLYCRPCILEIRVVTSDVQVNREPNTLNSSPARFGT